MKKKLQNAKLKFSFIKSIPYILISLILIIVISSMTTVISYLYKIIVDSLQVNNSNIKYIVLLVFIYILTQLLCEVLENIENHLSILTNFEVENNIKKRINLKLDRLTVESLDYSNNFDLISRVSEKVINGILNTIDIFFNILSPLISTLTGSLVLFSVKWYLPFILLISNFPYIIFLLRQNKRSYDQYKNSNKKRRYLNYWINVLTTREFVKEVKIFSLYTYIENKIKNILFQIFSLERKIMIKNLTENIFTIFVKNFSTGICLLITIYLIYIKQSTLGTFVLIYKISNEITNNFSTTLYQVSQLENAFLYLKDWKDFLNLPEEPKSNDFNLKRFDINFKNVYYRYPNTNRDIIKDLNIEIKHGEKIALVGDNGSGKSTFIYLLLGMFFPQRGTIFIGQKNIKDILEIYRKNITCVFQNFIKYQMTLKENIQMENKDNDFKSYLFINKIIKQLPQGINTILGQLDNDGYELSGGQWQRVALERACSKNNANIFIMDEPTSNIDPISEQEILLTILEKYYSKTIILVTHKMELCKLFDRILVMEKGKFIEDGSFNELLQKKGKYYQMYISQKKS